MLIDASGKPLTVIYRAMRYGRCESHEMETVEHALSQAYYDLDYSEAHPDAILVDDTVAYDHDAIFAEWVRHDEERWASEAQPKRKALPH